MLTLSCFVALASLGAAGPNDTIKMTLLPKDISKKVSYYAPQKAKLESGKPAGITKAPAGLDAPAYAELAIASAGEKPLFLIVDEPAGKPARLFIDANRNGDFTDDAAVEWKGRETKGDDGKSYTMYNGAAMVDIGAPGKPMLVNISMYRFDKTDPKRAGNKDALLYYRDYAYEGEIKLGGKTYSAVLADDLASGDFRGKAEGDKDSGVKLLIDVNGNGKFESRGESYDVRKPFAIGGKTYQVTEMTRSGDSFRIVPSKEKVAEIAPPPDHGKGKVITKFAAKDTEGKPVKFPESYRGKVVLIDFWATWCGPCMEEMPNVVETYKKHHAKGFEILGVSLDNEKSIEKMPQVMKDAGMTWRQIADGKGWKAEIAQLYAVNSIPATFLVDGTTGKVIGANLRGKALGDAVEKALKGTGGS